MSKGRVERANRTLQGRLVKEMRLRGIDGLQAGNAYLPTFMADFNRRFAVPSRDPRDAHRAVLRDGRELPVRLLGEGAAAAVEEEKTVVKRVDRIKVQQQSRPAYNPAPDHPWRRSWKPDEGGAGAG